MTRNAGITDAVRGVHSMLQGEPWFLGVGLSPANTDRDEQIIVFVNDFPAAINGGLMSRVAEYNMQVVTLSLLMPA